VKINQIVIVKEGLFSLYRKGDKFKIIKINDEPDLMPIEALHLRTKEIYGFVEEEFEERK
jgi:hypothetical protein